VVVRQLFTGIPVNLAVFEGIFVKLHGGYLVAYGLVAKSAVVVKNGGTVIGGPGCGVFGQCPLVFAVVQIDMAADQTVLHPVWILFDGGGQMGQGSRIVVVIPGKQAKLVFHFGQILDIDIGVGQLLKENFGNLKGLLPVSLLRQIPQDLDLIKPHVGGE